MSVYNPTGSGNVHVDRIMGTGGGKRVATAKPAKAKAKATKAATPAKPKTTAKKGMGFNAAAASAAKSAGVPPKAGAAMVAASTRRASPAARKANPNLKNVAMPKRAAMPRTKGKRGGKSGSK
jgi:hypothetical protein